jgi:hypothetical protein
MATDAKVKLTIEGKDDATPSVTSAAASVKKFGDHADAASLKAKSFGDNLTDLKPKADTISSAFGVMAAGAAAVTGVFIKAASASEALGGQLTAVGGAANDSFRALGDAIAASNSWNRAVAVLISGFSDLTRWITENQRTIDDLVRSALSPLARVAIIATQMVAGLAESIVVLSNTIRPYLQAVKGTGITMSTGLGALAGGISGAQEGGVGGFFSGLATGPKEMWAGLQGIWTGVKASERSVLSIEEGQLRVEKMLLDLETMMATGGGGEREITMPAMDMGRPARSGRSSASRNQPAAPSGAEWTFPALDLGADRDAAMASARGNLAAGKAYQSGVWGAASKQSGAYAAQIESAQAAQEQVNQIMVASANSLASTFLDLAGAGASASEMMRGLAQTGFGVAASAAGSLIPGWQGQAISAGIGLAGQLFGALTGGGSSRRQREYTTQDPLPVKVVNKEELQQVTNYYVTVAGSGLLQKAQTARLVGQAMRANDRSGTGAPAR